MTAGTDDLEAAVRATLTEVLDPCSCFTDEPVNVVDLGLIESVTVADGTARIELLLTSQSCSYAPYIERDIEERASEVDGIEAVDVVQVTDQFWTRDRMDDEVRAARRERFRERMEEAGITPYVDNAG